MNFTEITVTMNKACLVDSRLSWAARGFWAYSIAAYMDEVNPEDFGEEEKLLIAELCNTGYFERGAN